MDISLSNPFIVIQKATLNWWYDWVNQIVVNLAWALCCLTIVLAPPATFALYYASDELVRGTSISLRHMVEWVKPHLLTSWLWFLTNLFVALALVSNYLFYRQLARPWAPWAETIIIVIAIYWLIIQFYTLPFFVLQTNKSLKLAWRNALLTVFKTPLFTLTLIIYAIIVLAISAATGLLLFLGGVPLVAILGCQAARHRVQAETQPQ